MSNEDDSHEPKAMEDENEEEVLGEEEQKRYDEKKNEMKKFLPTLELLRQKCTRDGENNTAGICFQKLTMLYDMFNNRKRRLTYASLLRCEKLLERLTKKLKPRGFLCETSSELESVLPPAKENTSSAKKIEQGPSLAKQDKSSSKLTKARSTDLMKGTKSRSFNKSFYDEKVSNEHNKVSKTLNKSFYDEKNSNEHNKVSKTPKSNHQTKTSTSNKVGQSEKRKSHDYQYSQKRFRPSIPEVRPPEVTHEYTWERKIYMKLDYRHDSQTHISKHYKASFSENKKKMKSSHISTPNLHKSLPVQKPEAPKHMWNPEFPGAIRKSISPDISFKKSQCDESDMISDSGNQSPISPHLNLDSQNDKRGEDKIRTSVTQSYSKPLSLELSLESFKKIQNDERESDMITLKNSQRKLEALMYDRLTSMNANKMSIASIKNIPKVSVTEKPEYPIDTISSTFDEMMSNLSSKFGLSRSQIAEAKSNLEKPVCSVTEPVKSGLSSHENFHNNSTFLGEKAIQDKDTTFKTNRITSPPAVRFILGSQTQQVPFLGDEDSPICESNLFDNKSKKGDLGFPTVSGLPNTTTSDKVNPKNIENNKQSNSEQETSQITSVYSTKEICPTKDTCSQNVQSLRTNFVEQAQQKTKSVIPQFPPNHTPMKRPEELDKVNQSVRSKLSEEITTLHKVGTTCSGALRGLINREKMMPPGRIASLKPGTLIDLIQEDRPQRVAHKPKTKPLFQQILSNDNNHTYVRDVKETNLSTTQHDTNLILSKLSENDLKKLITENIGDLPTPPVIPFLNNSSTNVYSNENGTMNSLSNQFSTQSSDLNSKQQISVNAQNVIVNNVCIESTDYNFMNSSSHIQNPQLNGWGAQNKRNDSWMNNVSQSKDPRMEQYNRYNAMAVSQSQLKSSYSVPSKTVDPFSNNEGQFKRSSYSQSSLHTNPYQPPFYDGSNTQDTYRTDLYPFGIQMADKDNYTSVSNVVQRPSCLDSPAVSSISNSVQTNITSPISTTNAVQRTSFPCTPPIQYESKNAQNVFQQEIPSLQVDREDDSKFYLESQNQISSNKGTRRTFADTAYGSWAESKNTNQRDLKYSSSNDNSGFDRGINNSRNYANNYRWLSHNRQHDHATQGFDKANYYNYNVRPSSMAQYDPGHKKLSARDPRRRSIEESNNANETKHYNSSVCVAEPLSSCKRDPRVRERNISRGRARSRERTSSSGRACTSTYERSAMREYEEFSRHKRHDIKHNKDSYSSPLERLYNSSMIPKTGLGYGVQKFRIPKLNKGNSDHYSTKSTSKEQHNEKVKSSAPTEDLNEVSMRNIDDKSVNKEDMLVVLDQKISQEAIENDISEENKSTVEIRSSMRSNKQSKLTHDIKETSAKSEDTDKNMIDTENMKKNCSEIGHHDVISNVDVNNLNDKSKLDSSIMSGVNKNNSQILDNGIFPNNQPCSSHSITKEQEIETQIIKLNNETSESKNITDCTKSITSNTDHSEIVHKTDVAKDNSANENKCTKNDENDDSSELTPELSSLQKKYGKKITTDLLKFLAEIISKEQDGSTASDETNCEVDKCIPDTATKDIKKENIGIGNLEINSTTEKKQIASTSNEIYLYDEKQTCNVKGRGNKRGRYSKVKDKNDDTNEKVLLKSNAGQKRKYKNELDRLQDDISKYHDSEAIAAASGLRLCRLQKEKSQNNAPTQQSNKKKVSVKKIRVKEESQNNDRFDTDSSDSDSLFQLSLRLRSKYGPLIRANEERIMKEQLLRKEENKKISSNKENIKSTNVLQETIPNMIVEKQNDILSNQQNLSIEIDKQELSNSVDNKECSNNKVTETLEQTQTNSSLYVKLEKINSLLPDESTSISTVGTISTPFENSNKITEDRTTEENEQIISLSSQEISNNILQKYKIKKQRKKRFWNLGIIKKKNKTKKADTFSLNKDLETESTSGPDDSEELIVPEPPDKNYFQDRAIKEINCKLCSYKGCHIVNHYAINHPKDEVLISRMSPKAAEEAVAESKIFFSIKEENKKKIDSFICRICHIKFTKFTMFFEHVALHTGEFRHECCNCGYRTSTRSGILKHCREKHEVKNSTKVSQRVLYKEPKNRAYFCGYLCSICNFFQINHINVKRHFENNHDKLESILNILKINLSKIPSEYLKLMTDDKNGQIIHQEMPQSATSMTDIKEINTGGKTSKEALCVQTSNITNSKEILSDEMAVISAQDENNSLTSKNNDQASSENCSNPKETEVLSIKLNEASQENNPIEKEEINLTQNSESVSDPSEKEVLHVTQTPANVTDASEKEELHVTHTSEYITVISDKEELNVTQTSENEIDNSEKGELLVTQTSENLTDNSVKEELLVTQASETLTDNSEKEELHVTQTSENVTDNSEKEKLHVTQTSENLTDNSEKEELHVTQTSENLTDNSEKEELHVVVTQISENLTDYSEKEELHVVVTQISENLTDYSEKEELHVTQSSENLMYNSEKEEINETQTLEIATEDLTSSQIPEEIEVFQTSENITEEINVTLNSENVTEQINVTQTSENLQEKINLNQTSQHFSESKPNDSVVENLVKTINQEPKVDMTPYKDCFELSANTTDLTQRIATEIHQIYIEKCDQILATISKKRKLNLTVVEAKLSLVDDSENICNLVDSIKDYWKNLKYKVSRGNIQPINSNSQNDKEIIPTRRTRQSSFRARSDFSHHVEDGSFEDIFQYIDEPRNDFWEETSIPLSNEISTKHTSILHNNLLAICANAIINQKSYVPTSVIYRTCVPLTSNCSEFIHLMRQIYHCQVKLEDINIAVGDFRVYKIENNMVFTCILHKRNMYCKYTTTSFKEFCQHINDSHIDSYWDGSCATCFTVFKQDASSHDRDPLFTQSKAFCHLVKKHIKFFQRPVRVASNEQCSSKGGEPLPVHPPRPLLRVRRLSGDMLSTPSTANSTMTSNTIKDVSGASTSNILHPVVNAPNVFGGIQGPKTPISTLGFPIKILNGLNKSSVANYNNLTSAAAFKSEDTYKAMCTPNKLRHFYKCMGSTCSFTTSCAKQFTLHYNEHARISLSSTAKNEMVWHWDVCSYCFTIHKTSRSLCIHLRKEHGYCVVQCGICFYRAYAIANVHFHHVLEHPLERFVALQCKSKDPILNPVAEKPFTEVVIPLRCTKEACGLITYILNNLCYHFYNVHTRLQCHICSKFSASVEKLFKHYKDVHGICIYQCLYCLHGTFTEYQIRTHLCYKHPNTLPKCILRTDSSGKKSGVLDNQESLRRIVFNKDLYQLLNYLVPYPETDENSNDSNSLLIPEIRIQQTPVSPTRPVMFRGISSAGTATGPFRKIECENLEPASQGSVKIFAIKECNKSAPKTAPIIRPVNFQAVSLRNILPKPKPVMISLAEANSKPLPISILSIAHRNDASKSVVMSSASRTTSSCANVMVTEPFAPTFTSSVLAGPSATPKTTVSSYPMLSYVDPNARIVDMDTSRQEMETELPDEDNYFRCGNTGCNFGGSTSGQLKSHLVICDYARQTEKLKCAYCERSFKQVNSLISHLQIHGPPRFRCSLCSFKATTHAHVLVHMKFSHDVYTTTLIAVDVENQDLEKDHFIVSPRTHERRTRGCEKVVTKAPKVVCNNQKNKFSPHEIEQIPKVTIFKRHRGCSLCTYETKVRSNLLRHMKQHSRGEIVPQEEVLNPVPAKQEKMFDKMMNLAGSSHKKKKAENNSEAENACPFKYVPDQLRYMCHVKECGYRSLSETMLRNHVAIIHEENSYLCPHCPRPAIMPIDQLGLHLKLHDSPLFKCGHCDFHSHIRRCIEKHQLINHKKNGMVQIVRMGKPDVSLSARALVKPAMFGPAEEQGEDWYVCDLCKFETKKKKFILTHGLSEHKLLKPFNCSMCSYECANDNMIKTHFRTAHDEDPDSALIMTFYKKITQTKSKLRSSNVPLWKRNSKKIKMIRGISIDEKGDAPPPVATCVNLDINTVDRSQLKYGPFGSPLDGSFSCPRCSVYQTKNRCDFREHLYKHFDYKPISCMLCCISTTQRSRIRRHINKVHSINLNVADCYIRCDIEEEFENWVSKTICTQMNILKKPLQETEVNSPPKSLQINLKDRRKSTDDTSRQLTLPAPLENKLSHGKTPPSSGDGVQLVQSKKRKRYSSILEHRFVCCLCARTAKLRSSLVAHSRKMHPYVPEHISELPNFIVPGTINAFNSNSTEPTPDLYLYDDVLSDFDDFVPLFKETARKSTSRSRSSKGGSRSSSTKTLGRLPNLDVMFETQRKFVKLPLPTFESLFPPSQPPNTPEET